MTAGRKINTVSQGWGTPEKYVRAVREFFGGGIDLDPCSNEHSIVHARTEYQLPKHDGLIESSDFPTVYVNPPYGIDKKHGTSIKKLAAPMRTLPQDFSFRSPCPGSRGDKYWSLEELCFWPGHGGVLPL